MADLERDEGVLHRGLHSAKRHVLGRVPESGPVFRTKDLRYSVLERCKTDPCRGVRNSDIQTQKLEQKAYTRAVRLATTKLSVPSTCIPNKSFNIKRVPPNAASSCLLPLFPAVKHRGPRKLQGLAHQGSERCGSFQACVAVQILPGSDALVCLITGWKQCRHGICMNPVMIFIY